MRRRRVRSTSVVSIGYSDDAAVLEIELVGGRVYRYFEVPRAAYDGLMAAPSHGRYYNEAIKAAGYRYERTR